jgi:hypothetical protein
MSLSTNTSVEETIITMLSNEKDDASISSFETGSVNACAL